MSTERSLGPLQFIRVWHDDSPRDEQHASWYLTRIAIEDLATGDRYDTLFLSRLYSNLRTDFLTLPPLLRTKTMQKLTLETRD